MAIIRRRKSTGPGHRGYDVFDKFVKLLEDILGDIFFSSPRDIRGNIIFLRGSFALCPAVFLTYREQMLLFNVMFTCFNATTKNTLSFSCYFITTIQIMPKVNRPIL